MKETYLVKITSIGRGGASQCVPITPEVESRLNTSVGDTVRVTINTDLDSSEGD